LRDDILKLTDILVNEKKTIKEAIKIIDQCALGIAFIIDDDNKFVGVVTDGDIRRALIKGTSLECTIQQIMNKSPISVKKQYTSEEIFQIIKHDDIRRKMPLHGSIRIPVVDEKSRIIDILFVSQNSIESYVHPTGYFHEKIKKIKSVNKVLVVGGAGYLGSVLCRKLLEKKYFVKVLDNLTYGYQGIKELYDNPKFEFIKGDMRDIHTVVNAVKNVDAVIHLAAIVGDPASTLNPEETIEINYFGTRMLAEICKYSQINRFIFASTCSVYGASKTPNTRINENSKLNPVSLYAEMKLKSEQGILELVDENFSPTILRMATLYGLSPRMRFDLVVNTLTIKALKEKKFYIFGGEQWRPNLHVNDASEAYIKCLETPIQKVKGAVFNVGSSKENYKIVDIGKTVKKLIPDANMIIDEKNVDKRNYNVLFKKIEEQLNYKTNYTIKDGILEIIDAVKKGEFQDYRDIKYSNYQFLQKIINDNNHFLQE